MINGEPSSALKARGSEWGALIKVEHGRQGIEGGERSAGHTHQSLSASPSQGDSEGTWLEGTAALHRAELNPCASAAHCL